MTTTTTTTSSSVVSFATKPIQMIASSPQIYSNKNLFSQLNGSSNNIQQSQQLQYQTPQSQLQLNHHTNPFQFNQTTINYSSQQLDNHQHQLNHQLVSEKFCEPVSILQELNACSQATVEKNLNTIAKPHVAATSIVNLNQNMTIVNNMNRECSASTRPIFQTTHQPDRIEWQKSLQQMPVPINSNEHEVNFKVETNPEHQLPLQYAPTTNFNRIEQQFRHESPANFQQIEERMVDQLNELYKATMLMREKQSQPQYQYDEPDRLVQCEPFHINNEG